MPNTPVRPTVVFDATSDWSVVRGVHESNTLRTLALDIERDATGFRLQVRTADRDLQNAFGEDLGRSHRLYLDDSRLWGAVQRCRQVWRTEVVDRIDDAGRYLFQYEWDLSGSPDVLKTVLPKLAEAGADLFLDIFNPRPPDPTPYTSLHRVARVLRSEVSRKPMWIRITSPYFFAPWSLIYSDDPRNPNRIRPEGFWGFQHLIEHSPDGAGHIGYELQAAEPMLIGLQLDEKIDHELNVRCLAAVLDLLDTYDHSTLRKAKRVRKEELKQAFSSGAPSDHILYFCCHAQQEGDFTQPRLDQGYMTLTDRPRDQMQNRITPAEIRRWMDLEVFQHCPLVFLNACGGGQFNSTLYQGFAQAFLGLQACSVIGPQTEVPAVFAGEFARRFFELFFCGGNSVGEILQKLRRDFLVRHKNPLGIVYSLYRGADTRLRVPLSVRASSPGC